MRSSRKSQLKQLIIAQLMKKETFKKIENKKERKQELIFLHQLNQK